MERARHGHDELTGRQRQVLRLIERGHTNSEIAAALGISLQGAKWHVRELLGKFGADSREELIERRAAERAVSARAKNWLSALIPAALPKASILAIAGGASAAVIALAGVGVAVRGDWRDRPAPLDAAATNFPMQIDVATLPTPAPLTPAPLPASPGSKWAATEAIGYARQSAGPELSGMGTNLADDYIDLDEFTVTLVEWLPGISTFEFPGGDLYWDNEGGLARDIWHVRWQKNAVATDGALQSQSPFVDLTVDFLIEDGKEVYGMQGLRLDGVATGSGARTGMGAHGFRSRTMDERSRLMGAPTGPQTVVAWLNNVPGTESLSIYTALGRWCQVQPASGGTLCGFDPAHPSAPLTYGYGRSFNQNTGIATSRLTVETQPHVVAIRVITAEGAVYDFETNAPPEGVPQETRFAYLDVGPIGCKGPIVLGFNAAGQEIARRDHSGSMPGPNSC